MPKPKPDPRLGAQPDGAAMGKGCTLSDLTQPERPAIRRASLLTVLAALCWPVQAACAAAGLARLLDPAAGYDPIIAAAGFAVVGVIRAVLNHAADARLQSASRAILTRLRGDIIAREAAHGGHSALGGPAAVAAMAGEKLELIGLAVQRYEPALLRAAVVPAVFLALALSQSWAVAIIFLISAPLIPVFMMLVGWAAQAASARQLDRVGTLNDLLADRIAAMADLRGLNAQARAISAMGAQSYDLKARSMAVLRIAFLSSAVVELFSALGVAMVAVWVGFSLLGALSWGAWGALTPAQGIFLLMLAPDYYQPLRDLAAAWHDRAGARAAADEFSRWRDNPRAAILGDGRRALPLSGPAVIEWQNLALSRGGRKLVWTDARINPGETVALVGESGAGKTTLLRLLAGLERPDTGRITVAGHPLDHHTADPWRARLGWMPQTPHFLDATLRANLTFGAPDNPGAALRQAGADAVVTGLPRGLQTRLGENGGGLSGGEARRLTLARALYARPDVILADEPTADLDDETASMVIHGLIAAARSGATVIVATHDPALANRMDRVLTVTGAT